MEELYFYCQKCDEQITVDALGELEEGKCPSCQSIEGFSTMPKNAMDPFETVTVVNEAEMVEQIFKG